MGKKIVSIESVNIGDFLSFLKEIKYKHKPD